jgi:hypothetical protein
VVELSQVRPTPFLGRRQSKARVLAKQGSHQMYNTIHKSKEWLIINCVINVFGTLVPRFYIFKRERICDDYIQLCKLSISMAMQSKAWMTTFLFKEFLSFFKSSIPSGISINNKCLLILDGHGSHVTLEAIERASEFGLDMVILFSHTPHAFQPLDVACFKSFKTIFRKKKHTTMVTRKYIAPNKITLVGWVDKSLNQALTSIK